MCPDYWCPELFYREGAVPCPLRHNGEKKFISPVEKIGHLFHSALRRPAVNRNAADDFEHQRHGPEEPFFLDHDMSGSLDDPVADEGPDRIHVGGVGKTDDYVFAGKI